MRILVDIDGTVLSSELDNQFNAWMQEMPKEEAVAMYNKLYKDDLKVNYPLLKELTRLALDGHEIIMFTNRGIKQKAMTEANLGEYSYLFDRCVYGDGKKAIYATDLQADVIYDNEVKYAACAAEYVYVSF